MKFARNFPFFHTVFGVMFWRNFPSDTQTLENVARKISRQKFHDTFGRAKRRKISLLHLQGSCSEVRAAKSLPLCVCVCKMQTRHFRRFRQNPLFSAGGKTTVSQGGTNCLEDRNLLTLRSLDSSCPFFLSDTSIWGQ